MNQPKNIRHVTVSTTKITKKEVDAALAAGNTYAKFKNKGVQKRLIKNQEKIRRQQALREQQINRANKERKKEFERVKKAQKVLADAGKADAVVNEGVAALGNLIKSTISPEDKAALDGVKEALNETIEPGSIGGDLVDVDHNPENFGVQHTQEEAQDVFVVRMEKLADNQVMLNLYGDESTYKPLPIVGDRINLGGIVAAVRKFPDCELPSEEDRVKLRQTDINYIFDTLYYSPAGEVIEVSEDGIVVKKDPILENTFTGNLSDLFINPQQQAQMDIRGHALDIDIAETYLKPGERIAAKLQLHSTFGSSLHPSQAEVGDYINTPKAEQNGQSVKVQNSSLSGVFIDKAAFNADLPEATSPMSPLFHSTAHSTLTAACRAEPGYVDPVDPAATDEVNRTISDEQK